jgi:hypothetical protein
MPSSTRRLAAVLMVVAVVLANVAFIGLGSVFNYPDILQEPADEILAEFRADEGAIITLFVLLALSAALLAPIALLLGRLADNALGRWSIRVGIAAAIVQVIGLMRWSLIVPFIADREDTDAFETIHTVLGDVRLPPDGHLDSPHHLRPRSTPRRPVVHVRRPRSGSTDRTRSPRSPRRPWYRFRQFPRLHPLVGLAPRLRRSHMAAVKTRKPRSTNVGDVIHLAGNRRPGSPLRVAK